MGSSPRLLIGVGVGLCFVAAFAGALLALAIDDPDVVVSERIVEVASSQDLLPFEGFNALRADYVERSGAEDKWTSGAVEEIVGGVCGGSEPLAALADTFEEDPAILLGDSELLEFMTQVQSVCVAN
jgi:hypothetical protein